MSVLARIRPDLAGFTPYASARRSGHMAPVRLDANESPWPQTDDELALNRYPAPQPPALLAALADLYGVRTDQVWVGRGSDEAIDLLMRLFCRAGQDNVVTLTPTFGMYRVAATLQSAGLRTLSLSADEDFALVPERLLDLVDDDTRIVVLCSPNNPTGTLYHAHIDWLAQQLAGRALLLVDEAYIEFAQVDSVARWLDRYPHLAVLRTLSKLHALAGARIGSLLAAPELLRWISAIAAPYPVPAPSAAAAQAALSADARARSQAQCAALIAERERLTGELAALPEVLRVWPSAGNFLLLRCRDAATSFTRALAAGVLLRDVSGQDGLSGCLRVSIGTPVENDRLLRALSWRSAA